MCKILHGDMLPLIEPTAHDIVDLNYTFKTVERGPSLGFRNADASACLDSKSSVFDFARANAHEVRRTKEDIDNFVRTALAILRDAEFFSDCLVDIERGLREEGIAGTLKPTYYIPGQYMLAPGLPDQAEETLEDKSACFTLSNVILEVECGFGINVDGKVPVFQGFVKKPIADKFVAEGHVFMEQGQTERGLWHGIHSHRLQIIALLKGFEKKGFEFSNGDSLTTSSLLDLLITCKLWAPIIDNNDDVVDSLQEDEAFNFGYVNPSKFTPIFSARGPSSLNSFMLCFGSTIGLPCLQEAMLREHYSHSGQMAQRCLSLAGNDKKSRAEVYDLVISTLWFSRYGIGDFGSCYSFVLSREDKLPEWGQQYPKYTGIFFDSRQYSERLPEDSNNNALMGEKHERFGFLNRSMKEKTQAALQRKQPQTQIIAVDTNNNDGNHNEFDSKFTAALRNN